MRLGALTGADAAGLAPEVGIMIEMNEVDHLMLKSVFDIRRKYLVL